MFYFRYMLALALVGKLCSLLFFFLAWWFYRAPGSKSSNAVVPTVDIVVSTEKINGINGNGNIITNGTVEIGVPNGAVERGSNGYCNAALEASDHL